MTMSTNFAAFSGSPPPRSVSAFRYQSTPPPLPDPASLTDDPPKITLTEQELMLRLAQARAEGAADAEARTRKEFEARAVKETANVHAAIQRFEEASRTYYNRVEVEVVTLALSIAAKILHRESQVDATLVQALVQYSLRQLKEGSAVTIRVRPEETRRWQEYFGAAKLNISVSVKEDPSLLPRDCLIETELGAANLSLEAQLKEVERGFFDVLAQKPQRSGQ